MNLLAIILGLVALLILHLFFQWSTQQIGRKLARLIGSLLRKPFRILLKPYYRKKAIRQFQERRRKQGLPPLENTDLLRVGAILQIVIETGRCRNQISLIALMMTVI